MYGYKYLIVIQNKKKKKIVPHSKTFVRAMH